MENDRRHTAIHEAGHAVVGRVLTMVCGGATIRPDHKAGEAGHAITADPYIIMREWEAREKWREMSSVWLGRVLTFMAGDEAEIAILGDSQGGDADDRWQVALMLGAGWAEEDHERVEVRLRRAARSLVRRHRADIERVASALMLRELLTGDEVDAMLPPGFMARPVTWAMALAEDA